MIGKQILHYRIKEKLGEGGMGIVYLAEDTKLKRSVAIKFLPQYIATNSEERKRFRIEAQAAAALNHRNISTIHAIEESGDNIFIVMEYIEGQELKNIIGGDSDAVLSVDEAIEYAVQIAQGLKAAHEKGIIHRDIKSSNIMVTPSGEIKIMDFGLAKVHGGALVTKAGTTLGTVAYMSPEQARSEEVDVRTDIWAFGVLLYEMLAKKLPFQATHEAAMIYEIMNTSPVPLPDVTNRIDRHLNQIVMKCLEKDRNERYPSIEEVLKDLNRYQNEKHSAISDTKSVKKQNTLVMETQRKRKSFTMISIVAILLFMAVMLTYNTFKKSSPNPVENKIVTRITSSPGLEDEPVWAPDGKYIAYTSDDLGNLDILVTPLSGGRPIRVVDNIADDAQPAWSPDGSQLAFVSARDQGGHLSIALGIGPLQDFVTGKYGDIFLMPALGGTAVKLVEDGYYPSWSPDGKNIVFQSTRDGQWNLWRISVDGGTPVQLTKDEEFDFHPSWSPDGKWIVYGSGIVPVYNLAVIPADGGTKRYLTNEIQRVIRPVWTNDGKSIIYSSDKSGSYNLWKLDFSSSENEKDQIPKQITIGQGADVNASLSIINKNLTYSTVRVNQDIWEYSLGTGSIRRITTETSMEDLPRCSPDGKSLLITSNRGGNQGLWIIDLQGKIMQQLSTHEADESEGSWSPNGKQIAYVSDGNEGSQIFIRTLGSLSLHEIDSNKEGLEYPIWSPDGKYIVYEKVTNEKNSIWVYSLKSGTKKEITDPHVFSAFPTWSPDGKYITYHTQTGSVRNIWVIPSGGGEARQITFGSEEHSHPQWSPVDPDLIVFVLNHKNLCEVSLSTGRIKQLTNNYEADLILDYPSLSPDGKKIYYSISRKTGDLYTLENF